MDRRRDLNGRDYTAVILALGLALAVLTLTAGVLYDAIHSAGPGLSDNATQVLTAAFGGIIGVLGSYVGFQAAVRANGSSSSTTSSGGTFDASAGTETPAPDQGSEAPEVDAPGTPAPRSDI